MKWCLIPNPILSMKKRWSTTWRNWRWSYFHERYLHEYLTYMNVLSFSFPCNDFYMQEYLFVTFSLIGNYKMYLFVICVKFWRRSSRTCQISKSTWGTCNTTPVNYLHAVTSHQQDVRKSNLICKRSRTNWKKLKEALVI